MSNFREVNDDILKDWLLFREDELSSLTCEEDRKHWVYFDEISKKILNGEADAVANYRKFLTCGGSDYPINLLKIAGVDMAAPQPVEDTLNYFQEVLDELKPLVKK